MIDVQMVYRGSNADATKALYAELEKIGPIGVVAVNVFRACKASERSKSYRKGPGWKTKAYEKKDWSIGNIARTLDANPSIGLMWGWGIDEAMRLGGDPHYHVIYIDLPTGQVSFHVGSRYEGPDYPGGWDRAMGTAADRICRWCDALLANSVDTSISNR